jgi:hypothetical protein
MLIIMIRRDVNGACVIITQHDHSLLSGELARRLGNGLFAIPSPYESVVLAIAEHDCGWVEPDRHPNMNPQGQPAHVFEGEILTALTAWDSSVNQVIARDKYAGLLVSLHVMALANIVAAREPNATDEISRQKQFRIRRFVHRQIEVQEELRRELAMRTDLPLRGGLAEEGRSPDEDLLRANMFLLEFLDQLSLDLCYDKAIFQRFDMLYPRPGEGAMGARIQRDARGIFRLSPWPFNAEQLELDVPARKIPSGPFANAGALCEACKIAEMFLLRVVLQPAGT